MVHNKRARKKTAAAAAARNKRIRTVNGNSIAADNDDKPIAATIAAAAAANGSHYTEDFEMDILYRPKVSDINDSITCILCNGYYINATTIAECMHTFCKSCILKYLDDEHNENRCPICEVALNKTEPWTSLRHDTVIQRLVFKMMPQIFKNEMQRRREFYQNSKDKPKSDEDGGCAENELDYLEPTDLISMSLEYDQTDENYVGYKNEMVQTENTSTESSQQSSLVNDKVESKDTKQVSGNKNNPAMTKAAKSMTVASKSTCNSSTSTTTTTTSASNNTTTFQSSIRDSNDENDYNADNWDGPPPRRYLLCPASMKVLQLKKFVINKFALTREYRVEILYAGDNLPNNASLMDVAYFYQWTRLDPMRFFYRVKERPMEKMTESSQEKQSLVVPKRNAKEIKTSEEDSQKSVSARSASGTTSSSSTTSFSSTSTTSTTSTTTTTTTLTPITGSKDQRSTNTVINNDNDKLKRSSTATSQNLKSASVSELSSSKKQDTLSSVAVTTASTVSTSSASSSTNAGTNITASTAIKRPSSGTALSHTAALKKARKSFGQYAAGSSSKSKSSNGLNGGISLTDAKLLQAERNVSAKAAQAKAAAERFRKITPVATTLSYDKNVCSKKSHTPLATYSRRPTVSTADSVVNSAATPTSANASTNLAVNKMRSEFKQHLSGTAAASSSSIVISSKVSSSTSNSSSGFKEQQQQWKVSTSASSSANCPSAGTAAHSTSSTSKPSNTPLSPPPLRIKLTTSPGSSSSSSKHPQLIGQIISPIPPEVADEIKQASATASAMSSKSHKSSHNSSMNGKSSSGAQHHKYVTSQGVQSSVSCQAQQSQQQHQPVVKTQLSRGETIHGIIDRMASKGSLKSSNVNVSSTTPSLDVFASSPSAQSNSSALSSSPSSPAPSSPQPSSSAAAKNSSVSKPTTTTTTSSAEQSEVSTTTGGNGSSPSSSTGNRQSSGNLVLRISTKSLEVQTGPKFKTSNSTVSSPINMQSPTHSSQQQTVSTLTSAALSPSSMDSNSSSCSKKSTVVLTSAAATTAADTNTCASTGSPNSVAAEAAVASSISSPSISSHTNSEVSTLKGNTNDEPSRNIAVITLDSSESDQEEDQLVLDFDAMRERDEQEQQQNTSNNKHLDKNTSLHTLNRSPLPQQPPISSSPSSSAATTTKTSCSNIGGLASPPMTPSPRSYNVEPDLTITPVVANVSKTPQSSPSTSKNTNDTTNNKSSGPKMKITTTGSLGNNVMVRFTTDSSNVSVSTVPSVSTTAATSTTTTSALSSNNFPLDLSMVKKELGVIGGTNLTSAKPTSSSLSLPSTKTLSTTNINSRSLSSSSKTVHQVASSQTLKSSPSNTFKISTSTSSNDTSSSNHRSNGTLKPSIVTPMVVSTSSLASIGGNNKQSLNSVNATAGGKRPLPSSSSSSLSNTAAQNKIKKEAIAAACFFPISQPSVTSATGVTSLANSVTASSRRMAANFPFNPFNPSPMDHAAAAAVAVAASTGGHFDPTAFMTMPRPNAMSLNQMTMLAQLFQNGPNGLRISLKDTIVPPLQQQTSVPPKQISSSTGGNKRPSNSTYGRNNGMSHQLGTIAAASGKSTSAKRNSSTTISNNAINSLTNFSSFSRGAQALSRATAATHPHLHGLGSTSSLLSSQPQTFTSSFHH